jgi:hypothetical protein
MLEECLENLHNCISDELDRAFHQGIVFSLDAVIEELKNPTCFSCDYCRYGIDIEENGLYLNACGNLRNGDNKEFMEFLHSPEVEFEELAPKKFNCHKLNLYKLKYYIENLEN